MPLPSLLQSSQENAERLRAPLAPLDPKLLSALSFKDVAFRKRGITGGLANGTPESRWEKCRNEKQLRLRRRNRRTARGCVVARLAVLVDARAGSAARGRRLQVQLRFVARGVSSPSEEGRSVSPPDSAL
eukprot:996075-Prymnesium_polylepis.1